jgi:hypothetical protein
MRTFLTAIARFLVTSGIFVILLVSLAYLLVKD